MKIGEVIKQSISNKPISIMPSKKEAAKILWHC